MLLIIKGHNNNHYVLSNDSLERCKKAIQITKTNNISKIIISGGIFNLKQKIPISEAMKKYIIKNSKPIKIETEIKSRTTIENIENIIRKFSLEPNKKITFITSWYHIPRCKLIWKFKGFKTKAISSKSKFSLKKVLIEFIGIAITLFYFSRIKFPKKI